MSIKDSFLSELEQEVPMTRKFLERVPEGKLAWKPHDRSMTLGRLASHIAELPSWGEAVLGHDEFDMAPPGGEAPTAADLDSVEEIIGLFDKNVANFREGLSATSDEEFMKVWTLKNGGEEVFSAPRIGVVRSSVLNHLVHHRAQLSVYLRLNDVPVPPSYGPSADEEM